MKKDFLPLQAGNLDTWEVNFLNKLPAFMVAVGIDPSAAIPVTESIEKHRPSYHLANQKKQESKAATEENLTNERVAKKAIRDFRNFAMSHPGYTEALGKEIGFEGAESTPDVEQLKPTISYVLKADGRVVISFKRNGMTGVQIYSRRADETSFTFLALDTFSPYTDSRPNLAEGQPEKREYYAVYVLKDELVGLKSDIMEVTVSA